MSIIFGPVNSRRFGKSLGVDLSPESKQCNFDCLYCELAPAATVDHQENILDVDTVLAAITEALKKDPDIDVLTITANGEPTLYPHLLDLMTRIDAIKGETKTLILSNGSTIMQPEIQKALMHFDTVKLSLDCATPRCFKRIDRPHADIDIEAVKQGMLAFRSAYRKPLIIEVLIVKGINDDIGEIEALNSFLCELKPDRIDLGTIDRPPAYDVKGVSYHTLHELSHLFDPSLSVHVTHTKKANLAPSSYSNGRILATLEKRPLTEEDVAILFDSDSQKRFDKLLASGKITQTENNGVVFFTNP